MKKILLIIICLAAFIAIPLSAQAFDQTNGDFRLRYAGSEPWFAKNNVFNPGETKSKDFWAYNYAADNQMLYFISYSNGGNSGLADQMNMEIRREGNLIFKKKLSEIKSQARDQETLGELTSNSSKRYTFSISLKKNLGNNWQDKETGKFAFALGFGAPGRAPETIFTVFGTNTNKTNTTAVRTTGNVAGTKAQDQEADKIQLEPGEISDQDGQGDVEGIEKTGILSECGYASWIILLIIFLIIALIIWRRYLDRRNQE